MGIFRRHILPWSLAFFVLGFVLLYEVPSFPQLPYLVDAGVQRVILTAATFVMIWLLGGATVLKPSPVGMRSALREAGYPVIVSLGLCALDLVADASIVATYGTSVLSSTWLLNIFEALFLCVFVVLFQFISSLLCSSTLPLCTLSFSVPLFTLLYRSQFIHFCRKAGIRVSGSTT